ncbi:MAG: NAD-dependent epimerase/dehydratase family protein [Gemmatimonadales bacterium]|nr:MAG: NAD-dependent epimerase/dehydratase family protein [Gemmatimonadales bacterium]
MSADRRILVTGAGGFIGGRVVEALLQTPELGTVVPTVRRWSTLARIGRSPVEAVGCDLLEPEQVARAVEGMDSVVHCAVGGRRATVEGTRNLLEAALAAGVRRVVHTSTIDVYGRATGRVTEEHPFEITEREYGDSKIEAEELVREFVDRGLEVVILRPTIVYGPFSDTWTVAFADRLRERAWLLPAEACQGTCNLVHVDDVVRAMLLALDAPGASGRAYNVNGPDAVTWQEYVEGLNRALGYPPLEPPPPAPARLRSKLTQPVRSVVKAAYFQFEKPVQALYKKSPAARAVIKKVQTTLQRVPSPAEYDLYGREVHFPTERAEAELGYRPAVTAQEGINASAQWLLHEGDYRRAG